jgi:hypothetical protein
MSLNKLQKYQRLPGRQNAVYMAVIFAGLLSVTICGCESYDHRVNVASLPVSRSPSQIRHNNPNFVFDVPAVRGSSGNNISSEQFFRYPWPVSSEAYYPVTTYDVSSYDEDFYSDQYITSSGTPYQNVHKRTYGGRMQTSYR